MELCIAWNIAVTILIKKFEKNSPQINQKKEYEFIME